MKIPKWNKSEKEQRTQTRSRYSFLVGLFSVFVALILWFYVQDAESPDYKKTFTSVALETQSLSSSFSVIDGDEVTVDITLVGKRSDLNKLKSSDLEAYLDLSSIIQPGQHQSEVKVLLPEGTELSVCFPKNVSVFVDQTISKTVPVRVDLGNYTVGENSVIEATPALSEIVVKGPKTILDTVDHARITADALGQVSASFESNLNYYLADQNGQKVQERHLVLPEANMKVKFSVYKTKTVPLTVKGQNGFWGDGIQYKVTPEKILIKGEPALVDSVDSVAALILDEKSLDSNRHSVTVAPSQLALPEGIRLGEVLGDIKVSLTVPDNIGRNMKVNLSSNRVVITAPAGDLKYSFENEVFSFRIRGTSSNIAQALSEDFYFNVDLSVYQTPGEYDVPVEIIQTSESEMKYYPVGSYTVKVTIR
jgi:YbbR domain-containing protein